MQELYKNDLVEILTGEHKNKTGYVIPDSNDNDHFMYYVYSRMSTGGFYLGMHEKTELKLIKKFVPMFEIGDKIRGISADIYGCEGIIEEVLTEGYKIRFTKLGTEAWHNTKGWEKGEICAMITFWEESIQKIGQATKEELKQLSVKTIDSMFSKLDLISNDLKRYGKV